MTSPISPAVQGCMNVSHAIFTGLVVNQKLMLALDEVQKTVDLDADCNQFIKTDMINTHKKVMGANRFTADCLGELGSKGAAWQSAKFRICDLETEISQEELCKTLKFDTLLSNLHAAGEQLAIDYTAQLAFYEAEISKLNNQLGLEEVSAKISKFEDAIKDLDRRIETKAEDMVKVQLQLGPIESNLVVAMRKDAWVTSQIKDADQRRALLAEKKKIFADVKDRNAENAALDSFCDTMTFGLNGYKAKAARQQQRAEDELAALQASLKNVDGDEFRAKAAEIAGEVTKYRKEADAHRDQWLNILRQKQELASELQAKKSDVRREQKTIKAKLEASGCCSVNQYGKMLAAVKQMREQNQNTTNGFAACRKMLIGVLESYHASVDAFAAKPTEMHRRVLSGLMSRGGEGWLSFSQELGFTAKYVGALIDVLVDPQKAQGLELKDILSPSMQLMQKIEAEQRALPAPTIQMQALPAASTPLALPAPTAEPLTVQARPSALPDNSHYEDDDDLSEFGL